MAFHIAEALVRPFLLIAALLPGRRLVWLEDYDGEIRLTVVKRDETGRLAGPSMWPGVGRVVCLDDGRTGGSSGYVNHWHAFDAKPTTVKR